MKRKATTTLIKRQLKLTFLLGRATGFCLRSPDQVLFPSNKFFIAPDIRCTSLKYANIPAVHNSFRVLLTNTKPFQKSIIKTSNLLSRVGLANICFKYPSYFELY